MSKIFHSKSFSFLLEFTIVLFFFLLSVTICVLFLYKSNTINQTAEEMQNVIFYAENLIEQKADPQILSYLQLDTFYLDQQGNPTLQESTYTVHIQCKKLTGGEQCTMVITNAGQPRLELPFYLKGGQ